MLFICIASPCHDYIIPSQKKNSWQIGNIFKLFAKFRRRTLGFLEIKDDNQNIEWDYTKGIIKEKT
jgi:hypothetical protein